MRKRSAALSKGDIVPLETGAQVLAFTRNGAGERVLVVHNLSDAPSEAGPLAVDAAGFEKIYADSGVIDPAGGSGAWRVSLSPRSSGVWRMR